MNELHLFAGGGGGILGGMLLGHRPVCAVEIEPYCRDILLQRQRDGILPWFPIWDDVRTFPGHEWRGRADIVCGGFPCQDISVAGKGAGIDGERSGLWGEMARIIREVGPRYVFVENSPALASRGLGRVLGDLAEMGFDCRWGCVSAEDAIWLGGPPAMDHLRERIWILGVNRNTNHLPHGTQRGIQEWPKTDAAGDCRATVPTPCADENRFQPDNGRKSLPDKDGNNSGKKRRRVKLKPGAIGNSGVLPESPDSSRIQQGWQEQRTERERTGAGSERPCPFCGYPFDIDALGKYGCPNCCGEGLDEEVADTGSLRSQGIVEAGATAQAADRSSHGSDRGWWITEPELGRVAHELADQLDESRTNVH